MRRESTEPRETWEDRNRQAVDVGVAPNLNWTLAEARGRYVTGRGLHDDHERTSAGPVG